jgi:predicted nucleic acid-binding protein
MKIVADTNILFSALIKDGLTRKMIINGKLEIFSPNFITSEFFEHLYELENKAKLSSVVLKEKVNDFTKQNINLVDEIDTKNYFKEAKSISPDPDDFLYFALALKLNCPIWSNDKRLKEQKIIRVYSTSELIELIKQV